MSAFRPVDSMMGTFLEGHYDAQGYLSGGQLVEWFDEFVGNGYTTDFVVQ